MEHSNKFIEYYGAHEISPVKQDLSDLELHYAKREKLYRQLGIPCITFDQKKILEIGPGSGYNTLAFFAWGGGMYLSRTKQSRHCRNEKAVC